MKSTATVLIFLLLLVFLSSACTKKKEDRRITIVKNLELINDQSSLSMTEVLNKKYKVVAFFSSRGALYDVMPTFLEYLEKYAEIGFVFYLSPEDKETYAQYLVDNNIHYPMYYDPDLLFKKTNLSNNDFKYYFIGYIIDEKGKVICLSNPSLSNFDELLTELSNKK